MAKGQIKKKWYKLISPKIFNHREIGQTTGFDPKKVEGKAMKLNLSTLNNNIKSQNTTINLLIYKVEGDKAFTSILGFKLLPSSIRRLIRKGRSRLDQTITCITKDNKPVTIKFILVTRNLVSGSVKNAIQVESKRIVVKKVFDTNYNALTEMVLFAGLQRELKEKMAKIYPLRICDVKEYKIERFLKANNFRKLKTDVEKILNQKSAVKIEVKEEIIE